ncbi:MAG TPA: DUF2203 domain-containing protein [Gaiellaceae bacterium]|nr:DUF2203 domain-containing protein [Gaiellaceae bacterium]
MPPRVFTPDEANAALSELRPLVEAMVEGKRALDEAQERRDDVAQRIAGNGGGIPPAELGALEAAVEEAATTLAGTIGEIQALGVLVKDLDSGLVDFPGERDGQDILLCWQLGEDEVAFWHGLEDGYAGRHPL